MGIDKCIAYVALLVLVVAFLIYFFSYMKESIFDAITSGNNAFPVIAEILLSVVKSIPICLFCALLMWGRVVCYPVVAYDDYKELKKELVYSQDKHHIMRCIGYIKPLVKFTKEDIWDVLDMDKVYKGIISDYVIHVVRSERKLNYVPAQCEENQYAIFMLYEMIINFINFDSVGGHNAIKSDTAERILMNCIHELSSYGWDAQKLRDDIPNKLYATN